jgi:hypothetical protein
LTFELYAWRFTLRAEEMVVFPRTMSGNMLRGALGGAFRRLACVPESSGAYARVFEPRETGVGPSGFADRPRPFVFRSSHLDGQRFPPGASFHFDLHVFDVRNPLLELFAQAFAEISTEGLGAGRARVELVDVQALDAERTPSGSERPTALSLLPESAPVERVSVRFVSPTELKSGGELAERPDFRSLFARIRDRVCALQSLYGAAPFDVDFKGMGERAGEVQMTRCEVRHVAASRRSSKTGQVHPLGGFVGEAEYEGELAEFLPWLRAAEWTGVGRQTVWGKGQIRVEGAQREDAARPDA